MYSSESYNISFVSLKMASSYHFDGTHIRKIELSLNEKYQLVLTNPAICLQYFKLSHYITYYHLIYTFHRVPSFLGMTLYIIQLCMILKTWHFSQSNRLSRNSGHWKNAMCCKCLKQFYCALTCSKGHNLTVAK